MREEWNILPSAFLPAGQNDESVSSKCSKRTLFTEIIKRELKQKRKITGVNSPQGGLTLPSFSPNLYTYTLSCCAPPPSSSFLLFSLRCVLFLSWDRLRQQWKHKCSDKSWNAQIMDRDREQREGEIKGGKALKIQTVRWRQTPTRTTHRERERSLHKAWRFHFQNVWGGILWTVEVPESSEKYTNILHFINFGQKGTLALLLWLCHLRQRGVLLIILLFSTECSIPFVYLNWFMIKIWGLIDVADLKYDHNQCKASTQTQIGVHLMAVFLFFLIIR